MSKRERDIERYLSGEMSPSERHALEKAALNDPFLADALEGAEHAGLEAFTFDIKDLQASIYSRTKQRRKPRTISLWNWSIGIAAGLLLVAISGVYLIGRMGEKQRQNELARLTDQSEAELRMIRESGAADTMTIMLPQRYDYTPSSRIANRSRIARQIAQNEVVSASGAQREVEVTLSEEPVIARSEVADTLLASGAIASTEVAEEKRKRQTVEAEVAEKPSTRTEEVAPSSPAKSRVVKGRVTSAEDGSGLPGVNVVVKGTSEGAVTDAMGNYQLTVPANHSELVFAFIGLKTQDVPIGSTGTVDVKLEPDYTELSEVVVTGYGVSRLEEATSLKFAEPQGGRRAFQKYLEKQMQYPKQALDNKIEGKVTVQFTVETNGQLRDFEIIKGIGYGCDDEVIRLIKQGPAWEPTRRGDQPVTDKVKVRLKFDLPD